MIPVLVLCLAGFALTASCHLLALAGAVRVIPTAVGWVLAMQMCVCIALALLIQPKAERDVHVRPMSSLLRWTYQGLLGYAFFAALASAPPEVVRDENISMLDMLDRPIFLTAFMLIFSTGAVLASHAAVLSRANPHGIDER